MLSLVLAILNTMVGLYFLLTLSSTTPGYFFVLMITIIINAIGLSGVILWFWNTIEGKKDSWASISLKSWRHLAFGIDILLVVGFIFRIFVIQPFLVDGNSMEPNFQNQEFILVDRISYRFTTPKRGEVIVFRFPKNETEDYIKRIIGVPGDTISIESGKVYVNSKLLQEDYLTIGEITHASESGKTYFTKKVSQNEYFVMGDNRNHSSDSRDWGMVPNNNIIGRAWFSVYPLDIFGFIKNPQTNINLSTFRKDPLFGFFFDPQIVT